MRYTQTKLLHTKNEQGQQYNYENQESNRSEGSVARVINYESLPCGTRTDYSIVPPRVLTTRE